MKWRKLLTRLYLAYIILFLAEISIIGAVDILAGTEPSPGTGVMLLLALVGALALAIERLVQEFRSKGKRP